MEYRLRWTKHESGWTSDSIPGYWVDLFSDGRVEIGYTNKLFAQSTFISFKAAAPEIKKIMDTTKTDPTLLESFKRLYGI